MEKCCEKCGEEVSTLYLKDRKWVCVDCRYEKSDTKIKK